jgi:RND family efflux transporter MFP subunit
MTRGRILLVGMAAIAAVALGVEIAGRMRAAARLDIATREAAIPTVRVTSPQVEAPDQELVLPGNTQPYIDTPIYARATGYVGKWMADIGTHVKQGQLLAEIESPELDQQLRQARADMATAEANLQLAQITSDRAVNLFRTDSIPQQDRDNAMGALGAAKATMLSRQADVARLEQLQSFEKVVAPFDGVVTARNTDIGALIAAGATARELFHLAAINTLRVYVAVPEPYARLATAETPAIVTFDEFPDRRFTGKLARNANAIDPVSRTLTVEVDVENAKGEVMPGAYGFVHFNLSGVKQSLVIPANALLFRAEGLRVGVVRDDKAVLVPIAIDRDYGDKVEVKSGLQADDRVILDPSDSLVSGTRVRVQQE